MLKKKQIKNKLKLNSIYSDFKLIYRKKNNDIKSYINVFKHRRLGTELVFIENEDKKRAFEISFRTPSKNSKGIQHIIEHSVLRGSRKYDFGNEETFALLLQNSIVSFLNASTYPDKTTYPFSTNVESEFFKIMDIYLDSVLFPNLLTNENFFKQEGWRYDKDEKGNIIYNGVVFNEMKGSMSSASSIMFRKMSEILYKDTQNKYNSGGDPNEIVDLTYDEFKKYYTEYYHPTNANIYVYGDLNILSVLQKINNDFLLEFKKKGKKAEKIKIQKDFESVRRTIKYQGLDSKKSSHMSINFLGNSLKKREENMLFSFLVGFLIYSENSILKRRIIDSKLVNKFTGEFDTDILQSFATFNFEGIQSKDSKKIENIFYQSLKDIIVEGINKKALNSYLSSFEYSMTLDKYNLDKGLDIIDSMNKYKNYDLDFKNIFDRKKTLSLLKKIIKLDSKDKKSFESMMKRFLKDKSKYTLILKSDNKYNPYKKIDAKLKKINSNKESKRFKEIEKGIKEFNEYMKKIGTKVSKILPPKKSDIPKKPYTVKVLKKEVVDKKTGDKIKYYFSQIPEKNIKKVILSFDARVVKEDELQYYQLLISTINHFTVDGKTRAELETEKNNIFGQFSIDSVINEKINSGEIYSRFNFFLGYLTRNDKKVFKFINNFYENIDIDSKVIEERIEIMIENFKNSMSNSAHGFAVKRAKSKISIIGNIKENISGIEYLNFLESIKKDLKEEPEKVVKKLKNIFYSLMTKKNLVITLVANEKDFKISEKINIESGKEKVNKYIKKNKVENEAIIVNSLTNAFNSMVSEGVKENFDRKNLLLPIFISYGHLWKKIREEGGAYGGALSISAISRNIMFYSYMDSRISGTYNDFLSTSEYLKNYVHKSNFGKEEMDEKIRGLVASTLGVFLEPKSLIYAPYEYFIDEMSGYDDNERKKIIKDVLSFEANDFRKLGDEIDIILKKIIKVTIGPRDKIDKDKKIFDRIWELE